MGYWSIIVPDVYDITNLVPNPSAEVDAVGYTVIGTGTVTRISDYDYSYRGAYSIKVAPSAGVYDGAYYGPVALTNGRRFRFSLDMYCLNPDPMRIGFMDTSNVVHGTPYTFTGAAAWKRYTVDWIADATANFRLFFTKNNSASTALYYVDGLQLVELEEYDHTYIDGDQEGCVWNGLPHQSTSTKSRLSRAGGRVYNLDDYGFYITGMPGIGMPPITHQIQEQALLPGSLYRGVKINPRPFTLVGDAIGNTRPNLHYKRSLLINAIKADLLPDNPPFLLRYSGASSIQSLEIFANYLSGLEFGKPDGHSETVAMRMMSYDPFFRDERERGIAIATSKSIATANYAIGRIDQVWQAISSSFNNYVRAIVYGPDGSIYFGGSFTDVGSANGDYIVKWKLGVGFTALGTGLNGTCYALAVDAAGNVYAGGSFTLAGGVANTARVAKWNGSAWTALGTGIGSGTVYGLAIAQNGDLYAAGDFLNHVDANGDGVSKWNGSAWSSLGTGIPAPGAYKVAVGLDGMVYFGGPFTQAGTPAIPGTAHVCGWNGTAFVSLMGGSDYNVECFAVDAAGYVYAGGYFTTIGSNAISGIARWNGTSWSGLGSGVDVSAGHGVFSLAITPEGYIYAGGDFTYAGGLTIADRIAMWNGSAWSHVPINLPGTPTVYALCSYREDIYIGYTTTGTAYAADHTGIQNAGTTVTWPRFYFKRSGGTSATIEYIYNEQTHKTLWMNYALLDGESLIIDLTPGSRSVISSLFGNVTGRAILSQSDVAEFYLSPRLTNWVQVYVNTAGSPTMTQHVLWRQLYWSVDGVATV